MGYYSKYYLDIDGEKINKLDNNIFKTITDFIQNTIFGEIYTMHNPLFPNEGSVFYLGQTKWYEFEEDMCALSKKLEGKILRLQIFGEEDMDIRCFYFKDGKQEQVKVNFVVENRKEL